MAPQRCRRTWSEHVAGRKPYSRRSQGFHPQAVGVKHGAFSWLGGSLVFVMRTLYARLRTNVYRVVYNSSVRLWTSIHFDQCAVRLTHQKPCNTSSTAHIPSPASLLSSWRPPARMPSFLYI